MMVFCQGLMVVLLIELCLLIGYIIYLLYTMAAGIQL